MACVNYSDSQLVLAHAGQKQCFAWSTMMETFKINHELPVNHLLSACFSLRVWVYLEQSILHLWQVICAANQFSWNALLGLYLFWYLKCTDINLIGNLQPRWDWLNIRTSPGSGLICPLLKRLQAWGVHTPEHPQLNTELSLFLSRPSASLDGRIKKQKEKKTKHWLSILAGDDQLKPCAQKSKRIRCCHPGCPSKLVAVQC